MGDGANNGSQQQPNQQQANQNWEAQYPGYYNYGGIPTGQQAYMQYPAYQMPTGQMAFYSYGYGYGMGGPMQGMQQDQQQWMSQGNWNTGAVQNAYQMPPTSASSSQPPLPSLPPPPPPPPPPGPGSLKSVFEPPPPGSIKFNIPSKTVNKLAKQEKPAITIKIPQFTAGMMASSQQSVVENKPPASTSLQAKASTMPVDWPDSLRRYVERCFAMCKNTVDKDLVELILKGKITAASREGTALSKNWDNEPLPNLPKAENNTGNVGAFKAGTSGFDVTATKFGSPNFRNMNVYGSPSAKSDNSSPVKKQENSPFKSMNSLGSILFKTGTAAASMKTGANQISFQLKRQKRTFEPARRSSSTSSSSRSRSRSPVCRTRSRSDSRSSSRSRSPPLSRSSPPPFKKLTKNQQKKLKKKNQKKLLNTVKPGQTLAFNGRIVLGANQASPEKLRKRQARFQAVKKSRVSSFSENMFYREDVTGEEDWSNLLIVGTCMDVEKPFFRLTAAPDPSTVRPVPILKRALLKVKSSWIANRDYRSCCNEMKSIRQDLTVQGIRDLFTVEVYETHARLALEAADHEEFNQCQTQLKALHLDIGGENRLEFIAYRILYYIFTKSTTDLTTTMASLSRDEKADECVAHALEVRSSWALANFRRFFRLFNKAPRMSAHLMSWFADRERKLALKTIIKAYRPNIAVDLVTTQLGFSTLDDWHDFSKELPILYADSSKSEIDCKSSFSNLGAW